MASQSRQQKVLRIGIIQDGKIVQERLIKAGDNVTVGESAKNTFVFPKTTLPKAEFALFRAAGKGYILQFTDAMRGKISSGGAVVALQKLVNDPAVSKKGGVASLPLTQQDRGKIAIDGITVLFQFVNPPPIAPVKSMQAMDFRPRMMDDDDPVFLGFLAIWSALAMILVIWVWNTDPPEYKLEELPDRFTRMVVEPPEIDEDVETPEIEEIPMDGKTVEKKVEKKAEASDVKKDPGPKSDKEKAVDKAKQEQEVRDEVMKSNPLLIGLIGTRGEGEGVTDQMWEDDGGGDLDEALDQTSGVTRNASEAGTRDGSKGAGTKAAGIDEMAVEEGGTANGGGGGDVEVKPTVTAQANGTVGEEITDRGKASSTVKRNAGSLQYCYEKELKVNPSLEGRVEVGWTLTSGKVSGVYVVSNSSGNAELGKCITQKIGRWRFDPGLSGDISWPFLFKPK